MTFSNFNNISFPRSKAGNEWSDYASDPTSFDPKPRKYRPVRREELRRVRRGALDLHVKEEDNGTTDDRKASELPKNLQKLVAGLADVAVFNDAYR